MRSSRYFRFRAILLFVVSGIGLIAFPVSSFFSELTFGQGLGMGLFFSFLTAIVGFINWNIYHNDQVREKSLLQRIQALEKKQKESTE